MSENSEGKKQRDNEVGLSMDFMLPFYRFTIGLMIGLPLACVAMIPVIVFTGNKTVALALGSGISFTIAVIIMRFWKRPWGNA